MSKWIEQIKKHYFKEENKLTDGDDEEPMDLTDLVMKIAGVLVNYDNGYGLFYKAVIDILELSIFEENDACNILRQFMHDGFVIERIENLDTFIIKTQDESICLVCGENEPSVHFYHFQRCEPCFEQVNQKYLSAMTEIDPYYY